jgi:hypothetical protein
MLHRNPNSNLALDGIECQVFGAWTTILGAWTTIVSPCLGSLAKFRPNGRMLASLNYAGVYTPFEMGTRSGNMPE